MSRFGFLDLDTISVDRDVDSLHVEQLRSVLALEPTKVDDRILEQIPPVRAKQEDAAD